MTGWQSTNHSLCSVLCSTLNIHLWQVSLVGGSRSLVGACGLQLGFLLQCIQQSIGVRFRLRMSHYRFWQTSRERQDPAHWGPVRVCSWRPGQFNLTEISQSLKMLFKRRVWISQGHSFSRFHSCTVLCCYVCFTCNKLFNFTGWRLLSGLIILCEVTQRITTGVIPLESSVSTNRKGLTMALYFGTVQHLLFLRKLC